MRVLGIDPGSRFTGYGVVEQEKGRLRYVGHGIIRADSKVRLEFRLSEIFVQLSEVVKMYRPHAVAVEGVFFFRNARSALILGQARGIALLAAGQRGLPVYEYSPAKVKRAVGAGGADGKDAVARMVYAFLDLPKGDRADATDALAVAICHLNHRGARLVPPSWSAKQGRGSLRSAQVRLTALGLFADRLRPAYKQLGVK